MNARHVRSTFEAKEAMQYTNASICMGKLSYDFLFVPTEVVARARVYVCVVCGGIARLESIFTD